MEFGFYDTVQRKKLFQKNFPASQFVSDGAYHLYSLGTPKLPAPGQKFHAWGDESWNLNLNEIMKDFLAKHDSGKTWEIFVSVKADDKNLYLDRMIFAESGKKER
ncbi:MAG: hypothetical protein MR051_09085, partial [Lentisphaeria bacterium]|nr:hypothetical protein [Lentisphaeria bacterium]